MKLFSFIKIAVLEAYFAKETMFPGMGSGAS